MLRELAKKAGYSVHQRSSHGIGPAYDWSPKSTMESRHFNSEEAAWKDVEQHIAKRLEEAYKLVSIADKLKDTNNVG